MGATGQVGRVVVEEALARGLSAHAQSRSAARAAALLPQMRKSSRPPLPMPPHWPGSSTASTASS
ncbi:hypothetical protein [Actinomyces oris]|uniref:hypothetical protein n=1 Tax=Actinomyces oris TaxID=544580 RepID=UPI003D362865